MVSITVFMKDYEHFSRSLKPVFLDVKNQSDYKKLKKFLEVKDIPINRPIKSQIEEYREIYKMCHKDNLNGYNFFLDKAIGDDEEIRGEWFFLAWGQKTIFNCLPHEMHYDLLTWRNKEKLNESEQVLISMARVGVIGSSVGSFASKTLSKIGFQHLKLAEPKNMKPSNTPRMVMDSIRNYGCHKLVPLIHGIYEFNPFCRIESYLDGVQESNIDDFFGVDGSRLNVVVDAADDPKVKVLIREYCKKYKIALVYGFDEKGCIGIQRYDRPELICHNEPTPTLEELENLKKSDLRAYTMKLLEFFPGGGFDNLSTRQKKTIDKVFKQECGGFSQLAWEASLFGACLGKVVSDIVVGTDITGYTFIDLDEIITKNMARKPLRKVA
jgi:molybdopterin/thiamine biosynthesis adenylyltransferase